ncbi:Ribokinase [Purpureocillium takamizusanense]|uniref:Ribokinase n=1 Tax=Purpureocillium takamizusanense TaxID=2060973 RepID=A0A9Q8QL62_9HYPO|nr:Ribokinase [Purpureocillium takamizusanense]UNI21730.1 Ribokinase [Purpureocillium takamizusanense]
MAPNNHREGAAGLPRITILGSLNMDLVSYVPHHPLPGETLTSSGFNTSPGGKGANQAVACGKLSRTSSLDDPSAVVAMLGAVGGDDAYGPLLTSSLASYGVDVAGVRALPRAKTGIAIIVVDEPSGQNRIILSPEANHSLRPGDFATLPAPRPDLLIMQLEIPLDTVLQALAAARDAAVPVLLNPAPAQPLPDDAYRGLAHLVVNETEAAILSGGKESDLDDLPGMERVGAIFIGRGVQNVIITLGGRGVYYVTKSGKSALVQAQKANVVDTTAAGDTFVGSYALAAVKAGAAEFDIDTAVREANRAAAITVSRKGAQVSIPWKDELE